ncbi:hypothetical protein BH11MYX1_BH11MYX1_43950 [soil metagenome]
MKAPALDWGIAAHLRLVAHDRFARFSWVVFAEQAIELGCGGTFGFVVAIRAALGLFVIAWLAKFGARETLRTAHARLLVLWWIPIAGTLLYQVSNGVETAVPALFVELVCLALLVHTGGAIASAVVAMACETTLIMVDASPSAALYISVLGMAALFGVVLQMTVRRSLVRAELARLEAMKAQLELEQRMRELGLREAEREHLQQRLFHAQRLQAVGTLAAGLSHDMNNVLASITMSAQTSILDAQTDEVTSLQRIIDAAARGGELTHNLLGYSERGHYRKDTVSARAVVEEAIELARDSRELVMSYELEIESDDLCFVGDRVRIGQAIVNLCANATDAMEGRGTIRVVVDSVNLDANQARADEVQAGRFVRISVRDNGSGITEETRGRIFEPFFTTKAAGRGTGLGLAMVWGVTRGHGGTVKVESRLGAGTTFGLLLPQSAANDRPLRALTPVPMEAKMVMIVDDEQAIRETTQRMLSRCGYRSITAEHGAAALRLFEQHGDDIGLVILDMGMPVMGGAECFRELRVRSEVPIIIATGYAIDGEIQELVRQGAMLLEKPYSAAALRAHVGRVLGRGVVPIGARGSA